jgi:hypothetical protein
MLLEGSNTPIAFYAYLRGSLPLKTMQTHQIIVYDQADLNLGNGYNKANGKFTTPMNGTYVFHVATGAIDQSHASVELVVNGIIKDVGWADSMDHADRSFATTATPVSLKQGDVVLTANPARSVNECQKPPQTINVIKRNNIHVVLFIH